jgi:DNA-binding SARP family transcriptional activator
VLHVAEGELDLTRFLRLVDDARGAEPAVTAARLADALALWRGPPLADLADEPAGRAAAHLDELRQAAIEERIDADLALGRHAALVPELEEIVARQPYREPFRRQLIVALYRSGRQADALEAYAQARRTFVEELGTEPGRELQELQRSVLQADPALDAPDRTALPPPRPPHVDERKTVTVLVADLTSADMSDDPEARRAELRERSTTAERMVEMFDATVHSLGNGRLLGVFGVPAVRDDDALQAARAALALSFSARIGLATGEVVTSEPFVSGAPVEEATTLCDAAATGQVLSSPRTWQLLRHAVTGSPHAAAWVLEAVDPEASPLLRRLETPIVGRERELDQIVADLERAAGGARPHLVTIFGAPGIGKTRLAIECAQRLRATAPSVFARCRRAEREFAYAPLRELLTGVADGDLEGWIRKCFEPDPDGVQLTGWLAAAVGLGTEPGRPEETAWAARRLLAGLAHERPLLLVLDDVHWAAPAFLDLVESLVELARAPVLVLCLARPDLLEVRPHWGGGRLSSSSILLDELTEAQSNALIDRLSPHEEVDPAARERIVTVAEGNALFIEQLLAAALEGHTDSVPDSIQTLLAARLDRLGERDRAVAQAAAVCGTSFTAEAVSDLVRSDPSTSLLTLERRDLVRRGEAGDPGGTGWSFRHSLIRDVAYASLTKRRRAELHERLARLAIERREEVDLTAGYHLDQAVHARREAGERGARVDGLAARAAGYLAHAGGAAFDRDDMSASAVLLGRANALLPREAPERIELLPKLASALLYRREVAPVQALLAEASAVAAELGDDRLAARATLGTALTLLWTDASVPPDRMLEEIETVVPVLEEASDDEGLAMAEVLRFHALDRTGSHDPAARFPLALEYARRANARYLERNVLSWVCITLPRGTVPVDAAIERATEIRDGSTSFVRSSAMGALGLLHAMKGEFDEARELVEEVRAMLEELGQPHSAAAHSIAISEVEAMAGDDAAAERILRTGYEAVTAFGDGHSAMHAAWRLGLALARQGKDEEARHFAEITERADQKGMWIDVWWRVVLARVEGNRGHASRAQQLVVGAREQMASAAESGMQADALLESAEALHAADGLENEAALLVAEAAGIADRLGYVVAGRRAHDAQRALTA